MNGPGKQHELYAGVDEAGRGPLAGPVIAAAVILDRENRIYGLVDSKKLNEKQRAELFHLIRQRSLSWSVGRAEHHEIDKINILNATMLAMQRAVDNLKIKPHQVLIDGNRCPQLDCPAQAIIKGDQTESCISAASIIAKVVRDEEMIEMDRKYPGYGFAEHKGYPTRRHIESLGKIGVSPIHRRSFSPVQRYLNVS